MHSTESSPPFLVVATAGKAPPLVLDSPHSWRHWPEGGVATRATREQLDTSWDAWVDDIWAEALDGAAPLLAARFHRAYIDANRARDDIDPALLAGPWPEPLAPTDLSRRGMGLIRRQVLPGVPMYAAPLSVDDVRERLQRCYDPYHERLAQLMDDAHARHGFCLHIDCHSMKSVGNAMNIDCGAPRPDLVVSDLDGASAGEPAAQWVAQALRGLGYSVQINHPYRGNEVLRRHGRPQHARHALQIEIRRSLYMDEARCERHLGFRSLVADLHQFIGDLLQALDADLGAQLRVRHNPPQ